MRKARPLIQQHLNTGVDIKRPNDNYKKEFIYPIADGVVISKRTDGPYAQLTVELYQPVNPNTSIARFFNLEELDKHSWQFDHFHFEILKTSPISIKPSMGNPDQHFASYTHSLTNNFKTQLQSNRLSFRKTLIINF